MSAIYVWWASGAHKAVPIMLETGLIGNPKPAPAADFQRGKLVRVIGRSGLRLGTQGHDKG
jgi:hypothetical protein